MGKLIETVIDTVKVDVENGDITSLEILLENVALKHLLAYLPEDVGKDILDQNPCLTKI